MAARRSADAEASRMMVAMDVESSMNVRRDRVVLVEVWGPQEDRGARKVEDVAERAFQGPK
jgi:hypothetical protein